MRWQNQKSKSKHFIVNEHYTAHIDVFGMKNINIFYQKITLQPTDQNVIKCLKDLPTGRFFFG